MDAETAAPPGRRSAPHEDPAFRVFIDSLSYLKPDEVALVRDAYAFAEAAHAGQTRYSGEPYITHPLAVAGALAEWQMDVQAVVAALLHDVMEDTAVTKAQIAQRVAFPAAVADLTVDHQRLLVVLDGAAGLAQVLVGKA